MQSTTNPDGWPYFSTWLMSKDVHVAPILTGTVDRQFPGLLFSVVIGRRPDFFMWNMVFPNACFVALAFLQVLTVEYVGEDDLQLPGSFAGDHKLIVGERLANTTALVRLFCSLLMRIPWRLSSDALPHRF